MSSFRKRVPYYAYRCGETLAEKIPVSIGERTTRLLARGSRYLVPERRRIVEAHQRHVIGAHLRGPQLRQATAAVFESYGRYWWELFRLPKTAPSLEFSFHVDGFEHVKEAVAAGKGVILALPHLGSWDVAGAWMTLQGYPVTAVAEVVEPPELYEWFVNTRETLGMHVIPLDEHAGTHVLEALREGAVMALLADRDLKGKGVKVSFFGEETTIPAGPAAMALRTGATLLPVGCYFRPNGEHFAQILPPISYNTDVKFRDEVQRVSQVLTDRMQELIQMAPENWHVLQPLWPSDSKSGDH